MSPTRSTRNRISICLTPAPLPPTLQPGALSSIGGGAPAGPNYLEWPRISLTGGKAVPPTPKDYFAAIQALGDEIEVALVVSPDLYQDLNDSDDRRDVLQALLVQADALHDRLVIIDVPLDHSDPLAAAAWVANLRAPPFTESTLRNGAVYHPRLLVPDPLGVAAPSLRCMPCSGSVAGAISRQDLRAGAYITPTNTPIEDAVDLSTRSTPPRKPSSTRADSISSPARRTAGFSSGAGACSAKARRADLSRIGG